MQKSTRIINAILLSTMLLSASSMQSMESNSNQIIPLANASLLMVVTLGGIITLKNLASDLGLTQWAHHKLSRLISEHTQNKRKYLALHSDFAPTFIQGWSTGEAEEHNKKHCLLLATLPPEILVTIFSHCLAQDIDQVKSLKKRIKFFMQLSKTCKNFNSFLTCDVIGKFCNKYDLIDKNTALHEVIEGVNTLKNVIKYSLPALVLLHAGANPDIENQYKRSLLLCATTVQTAQIFINKGIKTPCDILWDILTDEYPSELITFYSRNGANTLQINMFGGCLLHWLAMSAPQIKDTDNFLKKAELLLDAIPHLINQRTNFKDTPLDKAQERTVPYFRTSPEYNLDLDLKLIELFRKRGGRTAKELNSTCTIF